MSRCWGESKTGKDRRIQIIAIKKYIKNREKLEGLIDRQHKKGEIYKEGQDVEVLAHWISLLGENILPRFILTVALKKQNLDDILT